MLDNVTGNVGAYIVVGTTASLLCVLLIMGLKLKWFRARMTFDQPTAQQETPYVGVYRSTFTGDFDSPYTSSYTYTPLAPVPVPARVPTTNELPQSPKKPIVVQATSKEDKSKKTKEEKPKVQKLKDVNNKLPKSTKVKAPKLPQEVKSEVQQTSGAMPKEAKTKHGKVKAPKSPKEMSPDISKPSKVKVQKNPKEMSTNMPKLPNKGKETKEPKPKVKDNTEKQLSNGAVKNSNNIFTNAEEEVTSTTNNTFLFIRPKTEALPKPQEAEDTSAVLRYSEDSFSRGPNRAMKTFSSMMPTKGQVDLSVSPIPQHTPGVLRNPIASGAKSYRLPRPPTSGSVNIDMGAQYGRGNQQFLMDLEDESET